MDYTAEQMVKLIILAETLLRYKAITPAKFSPAMDIGFHSCEDVADFELALDEAVRTLDRSTPPIAFDTFH